MAHSWPGKQSSGASWRRHTSLATLTRLLITAGGTSRAGRVQACSKLRVHSLIVAQQQPAFKTAVIMGGTRGIGFGIAKSLARWLNFPSTFALTLRSFMPREAHLCRDGYGGLVLGYSSDSAARGGCARLPGGPL